MEYIYEIPNLIDDIVCDDIINKFEVDQRKGTGMVGFHKVDETIKKCVELSISSLNEWSHVDKYLYSKYGECLKKYKTYVHNLVGEAWDPTWTDIIFEDLKDTGYLIQRTDQDGFYKWHQDAHPTEHRVFACILYLNTLTPEDGGTTDFMIGSKCISITPEKGKMLIFPSVWPYVHTGTPVLSSTKSKYIVTTFLRL